MIFILIFIQRNTLCLLRSYMLSKMILIGVM